MPKLNYSGNRLPKLCNDRGRAFVWYKGKRRYLGVAGTVEADEKYKRFKIALLENQVLFVQDVGGSKTDDFGVKIGDMLIAELCDEFLKYHESRLRKTDVQNFKYAIGYLIELYSGMPVNEFSPKKLRIVREQMVKHGKLCRRTINNYTAIITRIFVWGVEEEWVSPNTAGALKLIKYLPKGEYGTFDHPEREPVPEEVIRRTLPFASPTVATMIQVQYLLGMRPNEVFKMRVGDIDRTRENGLWYYVPGAYKTERFVGKIQFPLGKPIQKLITPYLEGKKPEQAVFSPRQAVQEHKEQRRAARKSPMTPSQCERDKKRAKNPTEYAEFYDMNSYRKSVGYAIKKGNRQLPDGENIPRWYPYLLRNSAATAIELEHGLDDAQAQLGHKTANMTRRYSKAQLKKREQLAQILENPFADEN